VCVEKNKETECFLLFLFFYGANNAVFVRGKG